MSRSRRTVLFKIKFASALLAVFAGPAGAGTVSIYSNADSGTGSLRWGITNANAAGGTNSINWIYGSGGSLTLLSDLPSINGNTTLDATNSITDFTLEASTNSMSLGGAVTLRNDSVSSTVTINEDITGAGSLTKTGDGVLVLTGANTYAGGTSINGGTLLTDGDDSLGASSAGLALDGGTLKIAKSFSSARAVTLNAAGGTFNTGAYTLGLYGAIGGAGALTKTGAGTLILGASNGYSGGTVITAGTVLLAAAGALPAAGAVALSAGGTLDLAGYAQTAASYSGPGTLAMSLAGGVTNLDVSGTADLTGGALRVTYNPQIILAGQTFTPITAGSLAGQFAAIYSPAAVLFTPDYSSGNSLVLTASLVPFTSIAATPDQRAIGASLEPLRAAPSGDLAAVMGSLYTLDTAALRAALDQLSPVSLSAMRGLALRGSELRSAALEARSAGLAAGGTEVFSTYLAEESDRTLDYMDYSEALKRTKTAAPAKRTSAGSTAAGRRPWSLFAAAGGITGKVTENGTAAENTPKYKFTQGALDTGLDYSLGEHLAAGLLAGYSLGRAEVSSPSGAGVDSRSSRYGVYAAGSAGALRLNLYAGRADDDFETERKIVFDGISRKASASPSGRELNLQADAAYELPAGTRLGRMVPFIKANYDRLETDAFTETGADSMNLSVKAFTARSLRSTAGLRYCDALDAGSGAMLKTSLDLAWEHEYKDQGLPLSAAFAAGGAPFTVNSGDTARDAVKFGARVSAGSESGALTGWLGYAGDVRKRYYSHAVTTGLALKF